MYDVLMSRLGNFCTISKKSDAPEVFGKQYVGVSDLMKEVKIVQSELGNKNKSASELVEAAIMRILRKNDVN